MRRASTTTTLLALLAPLTSMAALACSEPEGDSGTDEAIATIDGGNSTEDSTTSAGTSAGTTDTDSGTTAGTDDAGTTSTDAETTNADTESSEESSGGSPLEACPEGLAGALPNLDGVSFQLVATPPDDGYAEGFQILEGPVWIGGALHLSHIAGGGPPPKSRLLRLDGGALVEVLATAGSNGLALGNQGELVAARHEDGSVSTYSLDDLAAPPTPWVSEYEGVRFNSPNDLVISSADVLYFTDPDWQSPNPNPQAAERAYYVLPGQGAVAFAPEVQKPNGIVLSLDEGTVYVAGTNGVFAYPVNADGSVGAGSQVNGIFGGGFDGMTKDCAGNLYLTTSGQVLVVTPAEQIHGQLSLPEVTNVAFGGPDMTTLYATTLNQVGVYAAELDVPGFPY